MIETNLDANHILISEIGNVKSNKIFMLKIILV